MNSKLSNLISTNPKFLIILFLLLSSCKKENRYDCLKSTGNITIEKRFIENAKNIRRIEVHDNIMLHIKKDTTFQLIIEAGKNLLDLIKTDMIDENKLVIRNKNLCNWVRNFDIPIKVYLSLPELKYVRFESAKDMYINFNTDSLYIESEYGGGTIIADVNVEKFYYVVHANCCDIKAKGKTGYLYVWNAGVGEQHLEDLVANDAYIVQRANGDCYVNVLNKLVYEIHHNGNIYYKGVPNSIEGKEFSKGKLIKLN